MEVTSNFVAFRGGANGPAGLLLAINPAAISHISSAWSKEFKQNVLRLHLSNGRHVAVFEADVNDVLEKLGLEEFVENWTLDLERDIG